MKYFWKLVFLVNIFILFTSAALLLSQNSHPFDGQKKFSSRSSDSHFSLTPITSEWYLPIDTGNRQSLENTQLTSIGLFGLMRKPRPGIPAHLHTGVDFKRPHNNYSDETVFPAAGGKVISLRDDGPYAQIIIQHCLKDSVFLYTVYEHIAGIQTRVHETVGPHRPIARFMNRDELNRYGWQFDHVHFEIMKIKSKQRKPDERRPSFYYGTYCLECYNRMELDKRYYDPLVFFGLKWNNN